MKTPRVAAGIGGDVLLWLAVESVVYEIMSDDSLNQKDMLNRLSYLLTVNVN